MAGQGVLKKRTTQLKTQTFHSNSPSLSNLIYVSTPPHPHTPYVVSSMAPSVQRSRALRAATLFANSTMPFPVGRPRSSVTTMARSTGPNCEKA